MNERRHVLFTDESRFSLQNDFRRTLIWREPGSRYNHRNIVERDQYGDGSVMVWGGIMLNGRTDLHIFMGGPRNTVNALRYGDEVLRPHGRVFRGAVGPDFLVMEDKARPHRAALMDEFLAGEDIHRMDFLINIICDIAVPIAAAGASLVVIVSFVITLLLLRRRKSLDAEGAGPSIVVYPSHKGTGPQFLTKEIQFSLPTLRHAASLDDLLPGETDVPQEDTELLVPASTSHPQRSTRSNSFSCYGLGVIDPALYRGALDLEEDLQFPEGHLGRLWFSLRYEPATEKLLVSILKAKNLPSRTVGTVNSCDPFVRLHLIPDERRHLQSRQKKKTCNPYFDETFVFQVPSKELPDHILKLTVIDAGRTKRRAVIGHVTLPLRQLPTDGLSEQQLFKKDLEKEAQESISDRGELLVSLLYNENLHRLAVTVIEARRLKFREEGRRDSYVRVTLNQQYRQVKMKRTSTVRATDAPNYSECFNFRVPAAHIDVTSVGFQVLQPMPGYGRDKLIGKFVLGSYMFARGKALTHWNTAFGSPMEQVQHWHALCE